MKAVISVGNKQYLVAEGDTLLVDFQSSAKKLEFEPLLIISADKTLVGTPHVDGHKVAAEITNPELRADKVTAIRYKAKKRVHKVRGHRQQHTEIKITSIK